MPETFQKQTGKTEGNSQSNTASEAAQSQGANLFAAHKAHPGPVIPQNMPEQEGTKEERQAKAKELNK
ncbi:hypothetical protein F5Y00DRAFT_263311 [Daldinia vernicosa]|uniref:uncharacterized protein n=1 Tax=Daldinia vernicosa TaxID=114800 RepID=UPI002008A21B|nr:uncharacterized protein F5Y00DRAFT_263311 [Daldinia vernicosa]KAI0847635.1 hypothetical protein F5Y00DRAFT_263311 [Daldinia vernicosa]